MADYFMILCSFKGFCMTPDMRFPIDGSQYLCKVSRDFSANTHDYHNIIQQNTLAQLL